MPAMPSHTAPRPIGPRDAPRYIQGEVLVHLIVRWASEGKYGVQYWTACAFSSLKPTGVAPMWAETKVERVVTCLWCIADLGDFGWSFRELP
jgi:hypothetical protein